MDQTSWEAAENIIQEWTKAGKIGGGVQKLTRIPDAMKLFFADAESRNLSHAAAAAFKSMFEMLALNRTSSAADPYAGGRNLDVHLGADDLDDLLGALVMVDSDGHFIGDVGTATPSPQGALSQ
jgi:hypothetical protein